MKAWVIKHGRQYWDGVAHAYGGLTYATLFRHKGECLDCMTYENQSHRHNDKCIPVEVGVEEKQT